jgi:hypothetical protein
VEILRLLTEELRGINSKAVYARKGKYYLYGRKVLRRILSRKQINPDKRLLKKSFLSLREKFFKNLSGKEIV